MNHPKSFHFGVRFFYYFVFYFCFYFLFNSLCKQKNNTDFGELEMLMISPEEDNELTQIECSCSSQCSEPVFLKIRVVLEDKEHFVHIIYEPSGILSPISLGKGCNSFVETYGWFFSLFFSTKKDTSIHALLLGGEEGVVSGLSFVGMACEEALFLNGLAVHQIWFQVFFLMCTLWHCC